MISILVPNWCSGDRLRALVRSVPAGPDVELLVCDNGSDDGSADGLDGGPPVHVERPGRNLGFAGAVNLLARRARGDLWLILNPDCQLLPETLPALHTFRSAHPEAALVGLSLVDASGVPQPRYAPRPLPGFTALLGEALGMSRLSSRDPAAPVPTGPAEHLAGAALALTPAAFAKLDGLDERFWPAWFEDVDLSCRAKRAGLPSWHCAEARVRHEGGYTRERLGYAGLLPAYYGNLLHYARKHFGFAAEIVLRGAVAAGMALRSLVVLVAPATTGASRRESWRAFSRVAGVALLGAAGGHHRR